ncbi:dihydrofolate reductase [Haloferax mediterranei ATCC 33500]|uniref:dihydrofolate reductase n=1 Tax=Haloferax mediterranei (strain ATCC 33500 / DSM 1411 / JCM 8866 / NBRC 14739 / NCIMB 2177 / R-4) TaxID=523841 RepID=I3R8M4_HALMT|nr:dihydrofolate reductase [Haloferax mediterranei]AFK20584.1 dihydrofolate reductase [Haloferax mediterranei ATCC 33500]AHZ23940.1 dihydrofolate reductase [Haloferax mediterranei ATCC 33500]ELZ98367.1 dihydrofolate reductase [Haloferax mediterranei ATCC 33500]MDX5986660.1 dihydrofolate reductase [Haloferax mediterranei ATCC 33500]QCQ75992.1 dihydrofolate reductase [Haloferax mediterranei ATCC 33500]
MSEHTDDSVRFVLVAAVAENRVIGRDGDMPWHLPEDLKHFKATTMGHPVVMGRTTYESIARQIDGPLPGRRNIVLTSRDLDLPAGAETVDSVDEAVTAAEAAADDMGVETVYVVGGATVYEQFLDRASGLILTELDEAYEGDTYFPEWRDTGDETSWFEVDRDDRDGFSFVEYERRGDVAESEGAR